MKQLFSCTDKTGNKGKGTDLLVWGFREERNWLLHAAPSPSVRWVLVKNNIHGYTKLCSNPIDNHTTRKELNWHSNLMGQFCIVGRALNPYCLVLKPGTLVINLASVSNSVKWAVITVAPTLKIQTRVELICLEHLEASCIKVRII